MCSYHVLLLCTIEFIPPPLLHYCLRSVFATLGSVIWYPSNACEVVLCLPLLLGVSSGSSRSFFFFFFSLGLSSGSCFGVRNCSGSSSFTVSAIILRLAPCLASCSCSLGDLLSCLPLGIPDAAVAVPTGVVSVRALGKWVPLASLPG